jgi:hypothetical protein
VHNILKQASATASEYATEDQASDHSHQTNPNRQPFELNITEDLPTPDQLKSILEYVGAQKAGTIINGAKNTADAMKKLKENSENFQRPIVSQWHFLGLYTVRSSREFLLMHYLDCRLEQWQGSSR